MTKNGKELSVEELEVLAAQGNMGAKKELAKRLMERVEENKEKVVSILEDCVALGDSDTMLMLAQCCALEPVTEQNRKRIETLLSESALKGNKDAQRLVELMNNYEGQTVVDLSRLYHEISRSF